MRKRINRNCLASSENYEASKKIHAEYLKEQHEKNVKEVEIISTSIVVKKQKYVSVFGTLIPISETELTLHSTLISVEL